MNYCTLYPNVLEPGVEMSVLKKLRLLQDETVSESRSQITDSSKPDISQSKLFDLLIQKCNGESMISNQQLIENIVNECRLMELTMAVD